MFDDIKGILPDFNDSHLFPLDRSTLELWATCPAQASAVERGQVKSTSMIMEVGNGLHDAFSRSLVEWINSGGGMSAVDLRHSVEFELSAARPDIQPEVIKAGRPSVWAWAKFIESIAPENILAFDGGEGLGRGGQLAWDLPDLGCRATSEIDLLCAGKSPVVLEETDYKSGWRHWSDADVADSFQFQMHALLILHAYPEIEAVSTSVWMSRKNERTYPVLFSRSDLPNFEMRVRQAVESRAAHLDSPAAWPALDKCIHCPAAAICPAASKPVSDVARDPEGALLQLIALNAKVGALTKQLEAIVDRTGEEIKAGSATFGRNKPKSHRTPVAIY